MCDPHSVNLEIYSQNDSNAQETEGIDLNDIEPSEALLCGLSTGDNLVKKLLGKID